jgi:hypothetical protein
MGWRGLIVVSMTLACSDRSRGSDEDDEGSTDASASADDDDDDDGASASSGSASATVSTASADESSGTTSAGSDDDDDDDNGDDGPSCVLHHHETASPFECSSDASCCKGDKCVPTTNGSECVPLADDPAGIGEPCTARGSWDDCIAGTVCRGEDPETHEGRCIEFCDFGHVCDTADVVCTGDPHALCLPSCDPLAPVCPGTDACLPMAGAETFACLPDAWPEAPGGYGDPCAYWWGRWSGCDAGSMCVSDDVVEIPSCASDLDDGCCTLLWFRPEQRWSLRCHGPGCPG